MTGSPNELLRSHVTRVGFDLTLGKTHIAALVYLDQSIKQRTHIDTRHSSQWARRSFANFATGMHGCEDRGLVVHHFRDTRSLSPREKARIDAQGMKAHYTITKAGKLVIELLKEAGIYQEYADALPHLEVAA